jgi:hypothetical protein
VARSRGGGGGGGRAAPRVRNEMPPMPPPPPPAAEAAKAEGNRLFGLGKYSAAAEARARSFLLLHTHRMAPCSAFP